MNTPTPGFASLRRGKPYPDTPTHSAPLSLAPCPMPLFSRIATFILGLFLLTPASLAQQATFEGLGDLEGGTFASRAYGVSADGSVVVGVGNSGGTEAFRWEDGTMIGLGDLPGGGFESWANGVSADGSIVVGRSISENGTEAFRWEGGVMEGLGDLEGGSTFASRAYGVSADGSVVVGEGNSGATEAFRWEDGTMIGSGLPGDIFASGAFAASADGSVVVGTVLSFTSIEAFRWTAESDSMVGLGDLPGGSTVSRGYGVSADGSVVVGVGNSANGDEAFRWEDGTMEGLGDLEGGSFDSRAEAVSADGSVVVGLGGTDNGFEAFIWTVEQGMRPLKDVLENVYGLDLTGWILRANAVSADGMTIVGVGTNPDGNTEAWRAYLPPIAAPSANISPGEFVFDVTVGSSDNDSLTIANNGSADLEWNIEQGPSCASPADVPWLSASPLAGTTELGAPDEVTVTVDAADVDPDEYTAFLCVTTNDPDAELIEIPITMIVASGPPAATISPDSLSFVLEVGAGADDEVSIENPGGQTLEWSIAEAQNVSFTCASPGDIQWLSVEPTSGTTDPGNSDVAVVAVDATVLAPDDYSALLCVTTNDPEAELIEISVSLTVEAGIGNEESSDVVKGLTTPSPNPANGTSSFTVAVEHGQHVTVEVFDVTGRRVQTLFDAALAAGTTETLTLDTSSLPAGVYSIRATGENFAESRRVTVVR